MILCPGFHPEDEDTDTETWFNHWVIYHNIYCVKSEPDFLISSFFKRYLPLKAQNLWCENLKASILPSKAYFENSASDITIYNMSSLSPCRASSWNSLSALYSWTQNCLFLRFRRLSEQTRGSWLTQIVIMVILVKFCCTDQTKISARRNRQYFEIRCTY